MKQHLFLALDGQRYIPSALQSAGYRLGEITVVDGIEVEALEVRSIGPGIIWVALRQHSMQDRHRSAVTVHVLRNRKDALREYFEGEYPIEDVGHIPPTLYRMLSSPARFESAGFQLSPEALAYRVEIWNQMPENNVKRKLRQSTFGSPVEGLEGAEAAEFSPRQPHHLMKDWSTDWSSRKKS
jgi:hypothetical protein